jgi:guanylate kinase
MQPILPVNVHCPECEDILRELLDARQTDLEEVREHFFEAARSSGREPEEMRTVWLSSVMKMPENEMQTVLRAHTPRTTEQRRRKKSDHEIATGHSVSQLVSMVLLGYRQRPLPKSK